MIGFTRVRARRKALPPWVIERDSLAALAILSGVPLTKDSSKSAELKQLHRTMLREEACGRWVEGQGLDRAVDALATGIAPYTSAADAIMHRHLRLKRSDSTDNLLALNGQKKNTSAASCLSADARSGFESGFAEVRIWSASEVLDDLSPLPVSNFQEVSIKVPSEPPSTSGAKKALRGSVQQESRDVNPPRRRSSLIMAQFNKHVQERADWFANSDACNEQESWR